MASLHLPDALRTSLEDWARAGYPDESCGLLIGKRDDEATLIKRVMQARNLNRERARDRYLLDPQDFLEADREARAAGMDVLGAWHTHPDHPALPSETDRAAAWPDWYYVIVAVNRNGVQDVRAWRLNPNQQFDEEAIRS